MKKKIILFFVWLVLVAGLIVVLAFVGKKQGSSICRKVEISINYPEGDYFISEQDIRNYIYQLGDSLQGDRLSRIDIETLERIIRGNPYIARAEVYSTLDGYIRIDILQRKPIARVFNKFNQSFYISDDGRLMPVNPGKPAHVVPASGNISDIYVPGMNLNVDTTKQTEDSAIISTTLYKIFRLANYITKDDFLNSQIEQIYVNTEGDIELIPMVGDQLIIFGDIDEMQNKFENLLVFYKQGLSQEGWDKYDTINLKFHNQVVCTKHKLQSYGIQ